MRMTFRTIVFGGLVVFFAVVTVAVFLPDLLWNPPQTVVAHPYTPEQERGRILFLSNGCNYCHTQYVRAEDTAMGKVSQGGDYVFDNPMTLGSERTGPDLSYIGRKRSQTWEIEHLKNPRKLSPLSIMPNWYFLSDQELQAITSYLFALGDRVAQERMILPPEAYAGKTNPLPHPLIAPPSGDEPQGWATWAAASLQEGKELYTSNCLTCHGCAGNGLGSYGGTLIVTPANFKQDPFRDMPDDQWIWHVSEGIQGTVMPPWKESLTEEQRWKVIRYVQQIFAKPVMRDPDEGDPPDDYAGVSNPVPLTVPAVDAGKTIFTRECAVCHGTEGRGHGPYGTQLQPSPPDFGDGIGQPDYHYGPDYQDADYYWRVSEGLPWSAMPSWKVVYSEEERWQLVHYIRVMFTQTEKKPVMNYMPLRTPDVYLNAKMPENASFERGKKLYLTSCASCHGLAGEGVGWDGAYLNPPASDLAAELKSDGQPSDGQLLTDLLFGTVNTAMPVWAEFLPQDQLWDAVKYMKESFIQGKPSTSSYLGNGEIAANYVTLSQANWLAEGHVISATNGAQIFGVYCASCHGDDGKGGGAGAVNKPSGGPAAFPDQMPLAYAMWRTREGIPDTLMYPFKWLLSDADVWDVISYTVSLTDTTKVGAP